jgi:hypothetical protein
VWSRAGNDPAFPGTASPPARHRSWGAMVSTDGSQNRFLMSPPTFISRSEILTPVGWGVVSRSAWMVSLVAVLVARMVSMTTSWLVRGLPRQLRDERQQPVLDLVPLAGAPGYLELSR